MRKPWRERTYLTDSGLLFVADENDSVNKNFDICVSGRKEDEIRAWGESQRGGFDTLKVLAVNIFCGQ